jgi:CMP-N,N'-diacetyllegionaminic acid synthase
VLQGSPVVALVPARAGSKGLPGKNMRAVGGVSLVGRAVLSAVGSPMIDACFVSSDSDEILEEGRKWGAQTHHREAAASGDSALATEVVQAFIPTLVDAYPDNDPFIVYLQPTSPLRRAEHVEACLRMLELEGEAVATSVSTRPLYLDKLVSVGTSGRIAPRAAEVESTGNRQDSQPWWTPNGAIYVFPVSVFLARGTFPISGARAFWMDPLSSTDVDSEQDLAIAEALVRNIDAGILYR